MPTYTYACEACEKQLEVEQRISEAPLKKCPKCGKQKLRRLISGGNFILKGGGWYSDGYGASGASKKGGGGESGGGSDSGSGSSSGGGSSDSSSSKAASST